MDKSTPLGCLFLVLLVILFNIIKSGLGDSAAYGGAALFTAFYSSSFWDDKEKG